MREQGYTENTTIEYEISLDGDKGNQYEIFWVDTWRQGSVEISENGRTYSIPFEVREKTELQVDKL